MSYWHLFTVVVVAWLGSEVALGRTRRAARTGGGQDRDARSFAQLWATVIVACTAAGFVTGWRLGILPDAVRRTVQELGLLTMLAGMGLRFAAIRTLADLFTVDVAIRADHRLVDHGPYRYVRHPSYTGSLLTFLGFGLALGNVAALFVVLVPVTTVFLRRIRVEEAALGEALGDTYRMYCARTARLLPGVY